MDWTHDGLMRDLASHLRGNSTRFVWTDMQLGPVHAPRPDVYTMPKAFSRWVPMAYECKVSRSDFRADVTAGKWQSYLPYAGAVIFATPAGLIDKSEVPPGCGLMHRTDKQWRSVQRPTPRSVDNVPKDLWMKILLDGIHREAHAIDPNRGALINAYLNTAAIQKKFGRAIAELLSGRERAEQSYAYATEKLQHAAQDASEEYDRIIKDAADRAQRDRPEVDAVRAELCALLGVGPQSSAHVLGSQARRQYAALCRDSEVQRLTMILENVKRAFEQAQRQVPAIAKKDSLAIVESVHKTRQVGGER